MPSIAEILLAQGQQAAATRERLGQIWGQGIQNVGQQIAAAPAQYAKLQAEDRQAQMDKLALQNAQQRQAGQQALDQALQPVQPQGPQEPGAAPMDASHPYLDDNGLYDVGKLSGVLNAHGLGHLAPDLLSKVEAQNDAITKYQEAQQALQTKHAIAIGSIAHTALGLMDDAKMDFPTAVQHASQSALATGVVKPEEFQSVMGHAGSLSPDQQHAFLEQLRDNAARLAPTETLQEGAKKIDIFRRTVATNPPKPPAPSEASLAADAANPTSPTAMQSKLALDYLQRAKQEGKAGELKAGRIDGKGPVVFAVFDPGTKKTMYRGLDVTDRFEPPRDPQEAAAAATAAQVAQQSRAQGFQTLVRAKEELDKNYVNPYLTAKAGADNLREIVEGAKAGNKVEASMQALATTFAEVRSQGLNRVNAVEMGLPANAGNAWDRIQAWWGKIEAGKPVPENIQKDMLQFADLLDRAAYKKYVAGHEAVNSTWGTNLKPYFPPPTPQADQPASKSDNSTLTPGLQGLAGR